MWADNETALDYLGFTTHEQLIRDIVTNDRLLPVTVGVFGDWGGGKSSVLRMLQQQLDNEDNEEYSDVACLYFSAWTFEGYDDAKSALLSSILMQLGENKKFGPQVQGRIVRLLKLVDVMRLAQISLKWGSAPVAGFLAAAGWIDPQTAMTMGTIGTMVGASGSADTSKTAAPDIASVAKDVGGTIDWQGLKSQADPAAAQLTIREFREEFSSLIADTGLRSLVILIDDLDRCDPDRLVENLEAIKLFLNVPNTAFVIASDNLIMKHAIAHRYKAFESSNSQPPTQGPRDLVTDYIEKLIQIPYHLPKLSPNEIETYVTLLFSDLYLPADKFERLLATCSEQRATNPNIAFGYQQTLQLFDNDVPEELREMLIWSNLIAPTITEGLKGNPRQVKRFLNALLLRKRFAKLAGLTIRDDILVKLMILEIAHPDRFEELYRWQVASQGYPDQLRTLETFANTLSDQAETEPLDASLTAWNIHSLQEWLRLQPNDLHEVDLRDYYWISRDKLQGTVSGLALLSPVVRKMIEELSSDIPTARGIAVPLVKAMDPRDQAEVVRGLKERYKRNPGELHPVDGLLEAHRNAIAGALEATCEALLGVPTEQVPPAIAYSLAELANSSVASRDLITPLFDSLESSGAPVAAAIKAIRSAPEYQTGGRF